MLSSSPRKQTASAACRHLSAVIACCVWLSCGYSDGAWDVKDGRAFPFGRVPAVARGDRPDRVRELLGEPLEVSRGPQETWRDFARQERTDEYRILDRVPVRARRSTSTTEAKVFFESGRVTRVEFKQSK
jgi:hypothetical protein